MNTTVFPNLHMVSNEARSMIEDGIAYGFVVRVYNDNGYMQEELPISEFRSRDFDELRAFALWQNMVTDHCLILYAEDVCGHINSFSQIYRQSDGKKFIGMSFRALLGLMTDEEAGS